MYQYKETREDGFITMKDEFGLVILHKETECPNGGCCYCSDLEVPFGSGFAEGRVIREV
jgi:hypothetical protein